MKKGVKGVIFGPVPSRRLGWSLGVDLVPYKTCNLNCVYCECGKTTNLTNERKNYYKVKDILAELDEAITKAAKIDYITFSGSGEPCLYKDIGKIVDGIRSKYPDIKLAVLTNSSLLIDDEVFKSLLKVDIVLPSIDTVSEETFQLINRPHPELKLTEVLESLIRFRREFKGFIWVEIFICSGINDTPVELSAMAEYLKKLSPDKVQINTLDRPGTEDWVKPLSKKNLDNVLDFFKDFPVEVISRDLLSHSARRKRSKEEIYKIIVLTMRRRPLTFNDMVELTGYSSDELMLWLDEKIKEGLIKKVDVPGGETFYKLSDKRDS